MNKLEVFNGASHLLGAVAALAGTAVLVVYAGIEGDARKIVGVSIYGLTLFLLYLFSTLYHSIQGASKPIFRIFDHQAIYLLIAGTYTPFTLVTLNGVVGWWLFGAIWSLAAIGVTLDALPRKGRRILPIVIYIVMGWLVVLVLDPLLANFPMQGFYWLLAGGISYTSGVMFFIMDHRFPWAHGIWHVLVLGGSICHYFAILLYL